MINRRKVAGIAGTAAAALAVTVAATPAQAAQAPGQQDPTNATRSHDLPNPLAEAQNALRQEAVSKLVKGEATTEIRGGQRVIKLKGNTKAAKGSKAAKDRYVSYPVNREESIFTILSEFGTQVHPVTGGTAGPLHNQIAAPDRNWNGDATDDNSTYWVDDFDRGHYMDLMFGEGESFKDFYLKQSNGRFLAKGDVSDWVKVPYNAARYGSNKISDAQGAWPFVRDSATSWYAAQKAAGKTDAQITDYLEGFDKVDRYDYDGDGNYNEPDGYIDHFQAIHSGEGEEAGGGAQGADAIWSHRWYAYVTDVGKTGPAMNKAGGTQIGTSGIWIGDYTTEPENGGLGVFTHEFGHDLGLPDYYDTAGGDNGTGFWTLMSGGSWLNHGTDAIGTTPGYMGPNEKLQLGWLDYTIASKDGTYKLGPADLDGKNTPQAIIVPLPDKTVTTQTHEPHAGSYAWWSGSGNNLNSTLTRTIDLTGKSSASVTAWVLNDTEEDYDWAYAEASSDGGANWTRLAEYTGSTDWTQRTYDLTPYAGKSVQFRFHNVSDGGLNEPGTFVDDITVTVDGAVVLTDGVEAGDNGWTAAGGYQRLKDGVISTTKSQFYIAENRIYSGYDATLQTGPYNFGFANTRPDWVERFPYQNGLLVWYVDGTQVDNNTKAHPGSGMALPVDARPAPVVFADGVMLGNRRQPFDATFGLERTDAVTFHRNGVGVTVPSRPGISVFDDTDPNRYWDARNPWNSVKVAGSGTSIKVLSTQKGASEMVLRINTPN